MIRGLKPYPTYKDSGVPWLRKVPEHWDIKRNKFLLREVNERSEDGSEELLTVSQYTGVSINIMLAWNRSLGVSSFAGIVSPSYSVFRTKTNSVEPLFLHYLFRSPLFIGAFKTVSTGVVDSRLRLYPDVFLRLPSIVPPFSEQIAIVRFLGWVEQRIRRLIRARRKRIKLLEEYKEALIQKVVTGRFDVRTGQPYPAYKDSGVKWLGDVPEHWELKPLKRWVRINVT
jgi:type I restriction enzyme S subunit